MNMEKSCGAIVFTKRDNRFLFVIVQEAAGTYSFPKGHMEGDETEMETARREIFEETGLRPAFLDGFCESEEYSLAEKPGTRKRVTYFLAEFGNEPMTAQEGEIQRIHLLPYEKALQLIKYEDTRRIFEAAYTFLQKRAQKGTAP